MSLSREEHGEMRHARITSTRAKMLLSGTRSSWEHLAYDLEHPKPFTEAVAGPMAEGVKNEPVLARRFYTKHPEIELIENPGIIYHHDENHRFHDFVASSVDRMADGIPVECKWVLKRSRFDKLKRSIDAGYAPPDFRAQVTWHAWIAGVDHCWIVVGTNDRYVDRKLEIPGLEFVEPKLEQFMEQYASLEIVGFKPPL